jgi:hypothetical protein
MLPNLHANEGSVGSAETLTLFRATHVKSSAVEFEWSRFWAEGFARKPFSVDPPDRLFAWL